MDTHVYPAESAFAAWEADPATRWTPSPRLETLKAQARREAMPPAIAQGVAKRAQQGNASGDQALHAGRMAALLAQMGVQALRDG